MNRYSVLLLITLTAVAQKSSTSPPPFPPPGELIDVGGWKLHINCTGENRPGKPTVILEAGAGDFSVEWSLVQPAVAAFARVCSYDRAGDGWSELGPHPRTFHQVAYELHQLLNNAGVKPPFIMVGHSYGGWLVRQYQMTYPSDVAAMLLVEPGQDNPWRFSAEGKLVRSVDLATGQSVPPIKSSGPLRVTDIRPAVLTQMMAGTEEASKLANDPPRDLLPSSAQKMRIWALAQLGHVAAGVNPSDVEEIALLRTERLKHEHSLGDLPLIILTRGIPEETGPNAQSMEEDHRQDHQVLASMSTNGKLIVAAKSGHHIQLQQPELVVTSIREIRTMLQ